MKKTAGEHLLFGFTLASLAALAAWWTVFLLRAVEYQERAEHSKLLHAATVTALLLGHRPEPPRQGPLQGQLEIARAQPRESSSIEARLIPNHPDLVVRPRAEALEAIRRAMHRKRLMLVGEGGTMLVLLLVLSVMLYRMVVLERRHLRHVESFVAAVTHEMKTPLAGIKSLLQTMAAGKVPQEQTQQLLALGLKESERLEHTIENVLLAGKLRGGMLDVMAESIELQPFLQRFVEHRRRYLPDMPEALEFRCPDELRTVKVRADSQTLRTILENLVDNAFKYGGQPPRVVVEVAADERHVEVSVVDNGIGFEPEHSDTLFVPYRRALDPSSKSSLKHGTGLGLSISLELARRMGGRLKAESDGPGRGSRFTLVLERDTAKEK